MRLDQSFEIPAVHRLRSTVDALNPANPVLADALAGDLVPMRTLIFVDSGLAAARGTIFDEIAAWLAAHDRRVAAPHAPVLVPGGERCKSAWSVVEEILGAIERARLCRRSTVVAIGGGAVLDVVGFAAALAHRGVRLVRLPSTTLAQCDSGVGVKNGVNAYGRKNALGCFAVPHAVINDASLLRSLDDATWRCGFSEIVKVAIVKDAALFDRVAAGAPAIAAREASPALDLLEASAIAHLRHITDGGDPFETTSARPLDFGHWSAHRLEAMSEYTLPHGEAVAIGIAIDATYAARTGMLDEADAARIVECLESLGFDLAHPLLGDADAVLAGIEEFREHIGGELTIMLPRRIGEGVDVHQIDAGEMRRAIAAVRDRMPVVHTGES